MKRGFFILTILLLTLPMFAQKQTGVSERPEAGEGEINRQQEFFDPTRKKETKVEEYKFSVDYRVEVGYVQNQQRSFHTNWSNPFLHGAKLGVTFDFNLPLHFSLQTGLAMNLTYGRIEQHWRSMDAESVQEEYLRHGINQYYLEVPVRAYYTQKLWRDLNLFFYAGPKVEFGLAQLDFVHDHLSDGTRQWMMENGLRPMTTDLDFVQDRYQGFAYTNASGEEMYSDRELRRCNIQFGLGGGLEWDCYRLVSGYDFGLNNLVYDKVTSDSHMWEWGWYVSFAYRLNQKK